MRRILCPIAALAMAGLVSALPARAGEFLDFLEYFQAVEIVLETDFTESELDKILSKARVSRVIGSSSPEAEIKQAIEAALADKNAEAARRFLSESGGSCASKNRVFSCRIAKYEIVRNVGSRSNPTFRRQYDFRIAVAGIDKNKMDIDVKYSLSSDRSFR